MSKWIIDMDDDFVCMLRTVDCSCYPKGILCDGNLKKRPWYCPLDKVKSCYFVESNDE